MHGGAVKRTGLLRIPHRQVIANGEGLAMPHHHANDFATVRHPGADIGIHAHLRQADLVAWAGVMHMGIGRQQLFVRAPAQLGRRHALFMKARHRPGVYKLANLLRLAADLRVALGDVNYFHAGLHCQLRVVLIGQRAFNCGGARFVFGPGLL